MAKMRCHVKKAVIYMFWLTLGFACVYMYGLTQMEFISHRIKVELGESQRGTLGNNEGRFS